MAEHDDLDGDLASLREQYNLLDPRDVVWEEPPAGMWAAIERATADEPQGGADLPMPAPAPAPSASPTATPASPPVDAVVLPMRRRRGAIVGIVAAAAAALVLVVGGLIVARSGSDDIDVISATDLEPLGGSGSGRAELTRDDDVLQLRVQTDGLDAADGYLEVWMIDPSVTELVSLGPLRADGVYAIPAGVDPARFPIVDVSIEPVDGDPTHSGDSVLRGQLQL